MTGLEKYLVDKWEFSPEWIIHLPTSLMYTYFSLRSVHPLFFTNVSHDYRNSNIQNSAKMEVYKHLNKNSYPQTMLIKAEDRTNLSTLTLPSYPLIAKPNIGKRGLSAALLKDADDLSTYVNITSVDFLIQEYIDYPNECGIFYIRYPDQSKGHISSIGLKTLKTLTGDGTSTMTQLLHQNGLDKNAGSALHHYDLDNTILPQNEEVVIEPIGSHNRGTRVRSGDHLINDQLRDIIEQSLGELELYYGRLDIKYRSWEALVKGDFKIIEINTITSEPLSMYDANMGLMGKYKTIFRHLKHLQKISAALSKKGHPRMSLKMFYRYIKSYKAHLRKITPS